MSDSDKSAVEFNPQHRIVGAIILVILAIIILPMVLNEEQFAKQEAGNEITLSEKDAKVYVSKAEDILKAQAIKNGPDAASAKKTNDSQQQKKRAKAEASTPDTIINKTSAKKSDATTAKSDSVVSKKKEVVKKSRPAQKITRGWVVQIGTYSDPANAKKVRASLVRHGYHVRLEKIKLSKGDATRVRVGPFSDRGKAITTLSHIGRDVGLQGVVLRYP